jgi:hypothetical protein
MPLTHQPDPRELVSQEFEWRSTTAPRDLGLSSSEYSCFLTRIQGRFNGSEDWVGVYEDKGSWWLGGNRMRGERGARARCVRATPGHEYTWSQGQKAVRMDSKAHCFLTKVRGVFMGNGENVSVFSENDSRYLWGASQKSGVGAEARCVSTGVVVSPAPQP